MQFRNGAAAVPDNMRQAERRGDRRNDMGLFPIIYGLWSFKHKIPRRRIGQSGTIPQAACAGRSGQGDTDAVFYFLRHVVRVRF